MWIVRPPLVLIFILVTPLLQRIAGSLTDVKIKYVEGLRGGNDFIVAYGLSIPEYYEYSNFSTTLLCGCRRTCWRKPKCRGSSLQMIDGMSVCRLTKNHPRQVKFLGDDNATYVFSADTPKNDFYGMGIDGFFYSVQSKLLTYVDAIASCNKIPGHRLANYLTATEEQKDAMKIVQGHVKNVQLWVDNGSTDTYLNEVGGLTMLKGIEKFAPLCQANPLNLEW